MKTVTLTADQVATVEQVAAIVRDRYATEVQSRFGADGRGVPALRSLVGAYAAELALSLELGEVWHRGDDLSNAISRRADVGDHHEVRWSGGRGAYLHVYDPDSPTSQDRGHTDRRFWLVVGYPPAMRIVGWMLGSDVVRQGQPYTNPAGVRSYRVAMADIPLWPDQVAVGDARLCPSCHSWHPAGTTCAGGWAPWVPA